MPPPWTSPTTCGAFWKGSRPARPVRWPEKLWRRARRQAAWLVLAAAVLVLGVGLLLVGLRWVRPAAEPPAAEPPADDLPQAIAELDRADRGWRLDQIDDARKKQPIPDAENSALKTQAVKRLLPADWPTPPVQQLIDTIPNLPPTTRLANAQAATLRGELQKVHPALTEARGLEGLRQGRYDVVWRRDMLSTLVQHAQDCRPVAALLTLDAALAVQDGDARQAFTSCRAGLNVGRSLGDEPLTISQLVRAACNSIAVQGLERALAQAEPDEGALAAVQELLEDEAAHPMLLISARGERGGTHWTMTAVEAGDMPLPEEAGSGKPTALDLRRAHAWLLRHSTRLVEIARLPTEQQTAQVVQWDTISRNAPWEVRWLIVSGPKVVGASLRNQAVLRSAAAALAAERYRRAQGRWPASLADLVPAQLREVPADPYDGARAALPAVRRWRRGLRRRPGRQGRRRRDRLEGQQPCGRRHRFSAVGRGAKGAGAAAVRGRDDGRDAVDSSDADADRPH